MIIYENLCTNPYFNLASEQYLLDTAEDEVFMLWCNEPVVVIGKNQNAYAEIYADFVKANNIKVVRRLTGGGAVFHDLGNVNFTFIVSKDKRNSLDFEYFTNPIIEALSKLGVKASLSGRNDLVIDGYKFSGNAQCVYNGKTMHHGTLLFSSDISDLTEALNVDEEKIKSKGIKSIHNRVTNLKSHIKDDMTVLQFKSFLEKYISLKFNTNKCNFSESDITSINNLVNTKYSTWDWNYGMSKQYTFSKKKYFDFGLIEINLDVDRGIITNIKINGDYFGVNDINDFELALTGLVYERNIISNFIDNMPIKLNNYIMGSYTKNIIDLMF